MLSVRNRKQLTKLGGFKMYEDWYEVNEVEYLAMLEYEAEMEAE